MQCPQCQHANREGAKFCEAYGSPLDPALWREGAMFRKEKPQNVRSRVSMAGFTSRTDA
jgi:hypothetical protein